MDAKFQISSDEQIIGPVCDFTYSWSLNCGASPEEAKRFTIAVSELITDIILFAYPQGGKATVDLSYRNSLSNIELVVTETGEPFDPDRHRYDANKALSEGDFEGAGLRLIRRFCDEFLFINKGKEGKEFRLSNKIPVREIDERLEQSRSEKPYEPDADKTVKPQLTGSSFTYNQISPSDAEDIAKLIYRTYGYTYTKEDLYYPKKIEKTLLGKEKLGVITRDDEGLAVGYFAVLKKEDSNLGEVGEAVVSPAYRKRGIMSHMMKHLIDISRKNELSGVFGKAVTLHPVSQKVNHKFDFQTTALMLAETSNVKFKGFDEDYPQPVSITIDFLPLISPASKNVYLPEKYLDIILETYQKLGLPVTPKQPSSYKMAERSDIQLEISYSNATALLVVKKYGPDFRSVLKDMLDSMKKQEQLNAIYLDLPVENSATPNQFKQIEDLGFFIAGWCPCFTQSAIFYDSSRFPYQWI